jgi:GT2 family glycosyltransferase
MKVTIIVARNNVALTKKAVKSALANPEMAVLVVDNFSDDGTWKWLQAYPNNKLYNIHFSKQKSLAACWNAGLQASWSAGAKEALVLNNDVEIRSDTYFCLDSMQEEFITCISVDRQEQVGKPFDRSFEQLFASRRPHPDFSAFMIRQSVTDKVGWFNEDYYPAYVEDCDYHIRMHRAGVYACCVDLPFYHASSQTLKHCSEKERIIIQRGSDANRARFQATYGCLPGTPAYEKLFEV